MSYNMFIKSLSNDSGEESGQERLLNDPSSNVIDSEGNALLTETQRKRWGLTPGTELMVQDTPEGLLIRPLDPPLKKIYVEPTSRCNINCRTCVRNSWEEPTGFMDTAVYKQMIEDLRGASALETIAFWGIGEPLMHPDIIEMVSRAKGLGIRTELISNAVLLDRRMAEGLSEAGLDMLVISVDGVSAETYGDIRSGGNLDTVLRNVHYLNTLRSNNGWNHLEIGIEFVLMRRNLHELKRLRDLAYAMGASVIFVSNVLPYSEEFKDEILYWWSASNTCYPVPRRSEQYPEVVLPLMDERPEHIDAVKGLLRNNGIVNPVPRNHNGATTHCPFVWEGSMSIAWDGAVSPCIALMHSYTCYVLRREKQIRRYPLGNISKESVLNIWNTDEFKQFRNRVMRFEFSPCVNCGGCEFAESNQEDCFGNTFPVCGDCLWARGVILCP